MRGQPLFGQRHSWGHLCAIPTRFWAAPAPRCRCPKNKIWTYRKDLKSSRTYQSLVGPAVVVTALDTAPKSNYRHDSINYVYVSATCALSLLGQLLLDVLLSEHTQQRLPQVLKPQTEYATFSYEEGGERPPIFLIQEGPLPSWSYRKQGLHDHQMGKARWGMRAQPRSSPSCRNSRIS